MPEKKQTIEIGIIAALVAFCVLARFLPHPPNFAPIAALALFCGVYLRGRKIALAAPLGAMLISDIFLGFYEWPVAIAVYGCFMFSVFLGWLVQKRKKWHRVFIASLAGSVAFFTATNFAVWAFTPWYAKTAEGLYQCYFSALPFFKNTLLGDLLYTGVFFGLYETVMMAARQLKNPVKI
ncbi:MAG: hypothetical protein M1127_03305 [Patescibacteria group bacterium]|nr:hypothetical protein [Patescibacteria group bacterium]